jgi:hypothetical protein
MISKFHASISNILRFRTQSILYVTTFDIDVSQILSIRYQMSIHSKSSCHIVPCLKGHFATFDIKRPSISKVGKGADEIYPGHSIRVVQVPLKSYNWVHRNIYFYIPPANFVQVVGFPDAGPNLGVRVGLGHGPTVGEPEQAS